MQAFLRLMESHTAAGEWRPTVVAPEPGETERLRREAIALMALQHIARLLQGQGAPILFDE